jgi:transcriptional regulator with XRE-family HTH domain
VRWRTRIFELAKARGWSDAELGRQLGVNQSTIWRQRSGKQAPSMRLMYAAASVFHLPPFELWWQEREPEAKADSASDTEPERAPVAV